MKFFSTTLAWFLCLSVFGQGSPRRVDTLQQLLTLNPAAFATGQKLEYLVGGYRTNGDWGAPRALVWDRTGAAVTNRGCVFDTAGEGQWVAKDCESGEVDARWFGAVGDGTTDDTTAIQAALWYISDRFEAGITNGPNVLTLPASKTFLVSSTITVPRYTTIRGSGESISRGWPKDVHAATIKAAAGMNSKILYLGPYVRGGVTNTSRFVGLHNFAIDGNYDEQDADALWAAAIWIEGSLAKNFVFSGLGLYDTVGYSLFSLDGIGSSQISDCYFGAGAFLGHASDLKMEGCDVTGRTQGSSTGTPFPPFWLTRYSWHNVFSDIFLFSGPRRDSGSNNSIRTWAISSYDDAADTLTLATTNGLFNGMPVHWTTTVETNFPSGAYQSEPYFLSFTGSNVVQLISAASWVTPSVVDFTGGTNSSDFLVFGDEDAPLMLLSGEGQCTLNRFVNLRFQDNHGDLLVLRGADYNLFDNCSWDFSYTNTSRFLKFKHAAQGNLFVNGSVIWRSSTSAGYSAPDTLIEFDDDSYGNSFRNVITLGSTGPRVIDANTTVPANTFDTLAQSQYITIRGTQPGLKFEDHDVGADNTNTVSVSNHNWFIGNDVADANDSNYSWRWNGLTIIHDIRGETGDTPRFRAYGHSVEPAFELRRAQGTIASPAATAGGSQLGSFFWSGYDTNVTAARATMSAQAMALWTGTSNPTEILFETTPTGSRTRSEKLRILQYGGIQIAENTTVPSTPATNTAAIYVIDGKKVIVKWEDGTTNIIAPLQFFVDSAQITEPSFIDTATIDFGYSGSSVYAVLANNGVVAGTYTNPNVSVDAKGRISSISSGTTFALTNTGVAAGTYTWAGGSLVLDSYGRATAATNGLSPFEIVNSYIGAGANVSIDNSSGTNIVISSATSSATNGTPVSVDGGAALVAANFADTAEVNFTASDTNITASIIDGSIATNRVDSTFYGLLVAPDIDTATNILVNGTLVSLANLQDDTGAGGINWAVSGSNIKAYATNVAHGLTFTNGLTNAANVVQWAAAPGANISFTTNDGLITIAASTGVTNSGTGVSVDNGALLVYANLLNSLEIDPAVSGTNVTFSISTHSLETNKLSTNAFIYLLNRANHLSTQPWSTIDSTPTTLGGYGILNAQLTNATLTRLAGIGAGTSGDIIYHDGTGWTNLPKGSDGQALKLSSGLPTWDTDETGSSSGYLVKSVTKISVSNIATEVSIGSWTIPADTLNSDGDELEFYIPARYLQYTGSDSGYSYYFEIDGVPAGRISAATGDIISSLSSSRAMTWTVRVKRMSSTDALIMLSHNVSQNGGAGSIISHAGYLEYTTSGWDNDVPFALAITPNFASLNHEVIVYGSTVRKLR